jgi:hypothetical protein
MSPGEKGDDGLSTPVVAAIVGGCALSVVGAALFTHYGELAYYKSAARLVRVRVVMDGVKHAPVDKDEGELDLLPDDKAKVLSDLKAHVDKYAYIVVIDGYYARHYILAGEDPKVTPSVTSEVAEDIPRTQLVGIAWGMIALAIIFSIISIIVIVTKQRRAIAIAVPLGVLFFLVFAPSCFFFGFRNKNALGASIATGFIGALLSGGFSMMGLFGGSDDSDDK